MVIMTFTFFSCENFLDQKPLDQFSVVSVYQTEADIRLALNSLYRGFPGFPVDFNHPRRSEYHFSAFTDDVIEREFSRGTLLDFDPGNITMADNYEPRYRRIRQANEFLARVPQSEKNFTDKTLYNQYLAEARVIRTIDYMNLNFLYGMVPLLTEPTSPLDLPRRATRKAVFDFVTKELTEAAEDLPWKTTGMDEGRVTKGTALALKARHLLNGLHWYPDIVFLYEEALAASKDVYNNGPYSLAPGVAGFRKLFTKATKFGSPESIFTVEYDANLKPSRYARTVQPKGSYDGTADSNGAMVGPTANLVEAYQMQANGLDIHDPLSGYDPAKPWAGRDPRLDITILHEGEIIPRRHGDGVNDLYVLSPHPLKTYAGDPAKNIAPDHNRDHITDNVSKTGYYFQKYVNWENTSNDLDDTPYHYIRFAEVILMYAESVLMAENNISLAASLVNEIRARVNMPDVATSYGTQATTKNGMLDIILRERRLEFATEGPHRLFDIKRYDLGSQVFADPNAYGIPIGPNRKFNASVLEGNLDKSVQVIAGTRVYDPASYELWPIPQGAIDLNPALSEEPQ